MSRISLAPPAPGDKSRSRAIPDRRRFLTLLASLAVPAAGARARSRGEVVEPAARAEASATAIAFEPVVVPADRIYPALVLATRGAPGLVNVRARDTARYRVIGGDWLESRWIEGAGELALPVEWNEARLARAKGGERFVARFEAERGGSRSARERTLEVRSINEAPYFVRDPRGGIDFSWIFAAYVDEAHPVVDALLEEARDAALVRAFDGVSRDDPEHVYRQVYAFWYVLQQRGIRYARITPVSDAREPVRTQRVRFVDESLAERQSNCVDGCVLFASLLKRVGIEPTLVLVPGHMLLGFDLSRGGDARAYLETTMLGTPGRGATRDDASFDAFESAVVRGFEQYSAARDRFASPRDGAYALIRIEDARANGVRPITRTG